MTESRSKVHRSSGWRNVALASTALPLLLMAAPAAFAAPPANSLPGNFRAVSGGASYTLNGTSTNAATIAVTPGGTATALSWGTSTGTAVLLNGSPTPVPGVTQNGGMSLGQGATVAITGAGSKPLLLNDATGNPSEIYGTLTNSGSGPLYVSNANGVIVGSTGTITTGAGLGLIGYAQNPTTFGTTGKISVTSTTPGTGAVTVASGSTLATGPLLVAGNGAVNVGVTPTTPTGASAGVWALAGYQFSTSSTSIAPTPGAVLPASTASVTFSGGSTATPTPVSALFAAGNVTNTGIVDFSNPVAGPITIGGTFSNSGTVKIKGLKAGSIVNTGSMTDSGGTMMASGDITNSGTIKEDTHGLTVNAGTSSTVGNFNNTGTIDFTSVPSVGNVNRLSVTASNIYLGGTIQQATSSASDAALSATNILGAYISGVSGAPLSGTSSNIVSNNKGLYLRANSGSGYGVIDVATTAYVSNAAYYSMGLRFLSGSIVDPIGNDTSAMWMQPGTATDPFANNATLGYNLSLFPSTNVSAQGMYVANLANNSAGTPNTNLDGVLGGSNTNLIQFGVSTSDGVGNIHGDAGLGLADGGTFRAFYTGNINNPNGAERAGQTAFQYNFLPVTVANGGTAILDLAYGRGPSSTSAAAQYVNVLVNGNATLHTTGLPSGLPTTSTPIVPNSSYTNNHLVVQATGNIRVGDTGGSFYWPGLVYLNTVASAADPTTLSGSGSITLGGSSYVASLNNVLPAISSGGTGIFFMTNNLSLNGGGGVGTVSTSNDSWVNFANATIASSFASTSGAQFFGAYTIATSPTVTELGLQQLPAADFQPK